MCAPGRERSGHEDSCFTADELETLRIAWNEQHPNDQIQKGKYGDVWNALYERNKDKCSDESCWGRLPFTKASPDALSSLKRAHRPLAPVIWKDNPTEWLTSDDIEDAMKQYEREYPHFVFLGASPIDFDARPQGASKPCVWDQLCSLDIAQKSKQGKTDLAVIFNADTHDKEGSHWMTMYIDLNKGYILYFDSTGDPMPREVKKLTKRLTEQAKDMGIPMRVLVSRARHQRRDTECGIYGLYAVSQLLQGKRTPESLCRGRISDDTMQRFRKKFFNLPS